MKTIICLCVVFSVATVTRGHPFGDFIKQATGMGKQFMGMFPGMPMGDAGPFGDMMKQAEGMADQAGGPEKMMQMMQGAMEQMTQQGQEMMKPFMEQMSELQSEGASPEKFMDVLNQMKQVAEQVSGQ